MILASQDKKIVERLTEVFIVETPDTITIESQHHILARYTTMERALDVLNSLFAEVRYHVDYFNSPGMATSAESYYIFPPDEKE